jgi:hypothetical protein
MYVNEEKLAWLSHRLLQSLKKTKAGAELPGKWRSNLVEAAPAL